MVIQYRRLGTDVVPKRRHKLPRIFKMRPTGCPEISTRN